MKYKTVKVIDHKATGAGWRRKRERHHIRLRGLADEMSVSAPYLSDLERGRRNWSDELEEKYQTCLKVKVKERDGTELEEAPPEECTCHERDSSYACPKCKAEGYRGHCDPQLVEFDSVGRHWVEGRGLVLVVESDRDGDDFDDLFPHVKVDDEPRKLLAVEFGVPVRKGNLLGLLVRETAEDKRRRGAAMAFTEGIQGNETAYEWPVGGPPGHEGPQGIQGHPQGGQLGHQGTRF